MIQNYVPSKIRRTAVSSLPLSLALVGAAVTQVSAAIVTWDNKAPITSSPTDVSTQGTSLLAAHFNKGNGPETVNGVNFTEYDLFTFTPTVASGLTFNALNLLPGGTASGVAAAGPATGSYLDILNGISAGGTFYHNFVKLSGLTVGRDYLVQIWSATYANSPPVPQIITAFSPPPVDTAHTGFAPGDPNGPLAGNLDTNINGQTLTWKDGSATVPQHFVIGRFTATAAEIGFDFFIQASARINAFQVRDITIPEPAALSLLGFGAIGVTAIARRRRGAK